MPDDTRHPFGAGRNGHSGTNGSRPPGMRSQPVAFDELADPVDLVAVQADDELINALAAGMSVSSPGVGGYDADDRVAAILAAWKADVDAEPMPELVDVDTAVSTVLAARQPSGRSRHLVPVAAAAAFLVLAIGGVSVTSYNAQPDDALWGISKVLYSERAESVEAAARVEERIENAKDALASGQPVRAAQELAQAEKDLQTVRPQEGQGELAEAQDFLQAKAAETPEGTKVNPASPLATQPSRPVPDSVRGSRPSESDDPSTPTRRPDSSSAAGEGEPDPDVATTPDENTGNPTTQPTNDPRRAVAPEQGGPAHTSEPAAPPPGNGEGGPDKPATGGSNPPATTEGGPDHTTSPAPPPRQDEGDGEAPDTGGPSASGEEAPATSN
ncbi:anti-sigma-D factor RsdA [Pseudonocardia cypriaca]|uniref:Anti-sigma-D factor RsdA-like protein n=1 Tax=Pseudonocardia cypriaca TaxID=882449 RepID=A0A543FMS6_9PSEU|nr:anti-sigma-D factor RsdA [Pseudonocardia cypriaca]TQM35177.1 anti-sigma-D factor RsdA-like protein [Pseudonocardia cypriaca]